MVSSVDDYAPDTTNSQSQNGVHLLHFQTSTPLSRALTSAKSQQSPFVLTQSYKPPNTPDVFHQDP